MNPIREAMWNLPGHWFKGAMVDHENIQNMCGIGHLAELTLSDEKADDTVFYKAVGLMNKVAVEQFPERMGWRFDNYVKGDSGSMLFADFNDHEDTTEEEVLAVMDKAAVLWDEEQA